MSRTLVALTLMAAALAADAATVVLYSRADAVHARRAYVLARAFAPAFMDSDLAPGVPWRETISREICAADVVLLVWSARAAASAEVAREVDTGLRCRAPIVPILVDDTPLPLGLASTQAVDWR